jgi:GTPase SAR1 family protein
MAEELIRIKLITIGDVSVGKTNLVNRYLGKPFKVSEKPTIGAEFASLDKTFKGKKLQI